MTPCPEICTFMHVGGPRITQWLARYVTTRTPVKGSPYLDFLPLMFCAPTEREVIAKAVDWWAAEQAKEAAKTDRLQALRDRKKVAA